MGERSRWRERKQLFNDNENIDVFRNLTENTIAYSGGHNIYITLIENNDRQCNIRFKDDGWGAEEKRFDFSLKKWGYFAHWKNTVFSLAYSHFTAAPWRYFRSLQKNKNKFCIFARLFVPL